MRYISTRGSAGSQASSFSDILLEGLAGDGGLYVPAEYPQLDAATLASWRDVLATQTDIAYTGPSGPFRFDDAGDRVGSSSLRYIYDATGSLTLAEPPQ